MDSSAKTSVLFRAAWVLLGAGLVASLALWGGDLAANLPETPKPTTPPAGMVVTTYSSSNKVDRKAVCAELSPRVKTVIVESTTGNLIATLTC